MGAMSEYFDDNDDDELLPFKLETLWDQYFEPWHRQVMSVYYGVTEERYDELLAENHESMTMRRDLYRAAELLREFLGGRIDDELKEMTDE